MPVPAGNQVEVKQYIAGLVVGAFSVYLAYVVGTSPRIQRFLRRLATRRHRERYEREMGRPWETEPCLTERTPHGMRYKNHWFVGPKCKKCGIVVEGFR